MKLTGRIEHWKYVEYTNRIHGAIYGDINNRFIDGELIITSPVSEWPGLPSTPLTKHDLVRTKNSCYVLGEPSDR